MGCTGCVRETTIDHSDLVAIFQSESLMRTGRPSLLLFVLLLGSHAYPGGTALAEADWWSLRELARPRVPTVKDCSWVRTPVDAFVLAALEANGLQPSPAAA